MSSKFLPSVFLLIWCNFVLCSSLECVKENLHNIQHHFATKTGYRFVQNLDDEPLVYERCTPQRAWGLVRHGSRSPGKKLIKIMKNELMDIRDKIVKNSNLCADEIERFKLWSPIFQEDEEKFLVAEGEDELIQLAERMQKRFPPVFSKYYDNSTYKFKFTKTQRTLKSFESFATGLFGRQNIKQIWYPEPEHRDPILRFYKLCKRWKEFVDKNPESVREFFIFAESQHVRNAVDEIKNRAGLNYLTWHEIHSMYMTCAFETASKKSGFSPWCVLFTEETIKTFEFLEDLEYYWIDGYGNQLTYQQACPAIIDLLDHISPASTHPEATVYFTHSGTILKFLARLNLYRDSNHLKHSDFLKSRLWNVSKIDAFASNIFFIAYRCEDDRTKILTLHQEQVVRIPGCDENSDLCDFDVFKKIFENDYNNCNFDEMCSM